MKNKYRGNKNNCLINQKNLRIHQFNQNYIDEFKRVYIYISFIKKNLEFIIYFIYINIYN
jgi:hypothetical protein